MSRETLNEPRNDLFCQFCGKQCKNLNSLNQHSTRCKQNPNRKDFDRLGKYSTSLKGQNQYNNDRIRKTTQALKDKYENGYVSPIKGRKIEFSYVYEEHNNQEINKWLNYIKEKSFLIEHKSCIIHPEGYKVISKEYIKENNSILLLFEHNYVANILIEGNMLKGNCVHHIDKNRCNNEPLNLMIFEDSKQHKRFHNSKYAYLTYNEETHLFSCKLIK